MGISARSDVFDQIVFANSNRGIPIEMEQAEISAADGVKLLGDYEQRRSGATSDGGLVLNAGVLTT